MNKKIALIPIDARPVTRELPKQIAEIGGWDVLIPDKEQLGFLKKPGEMEELISWLLSIADKVDGFVISADMIGYGGLVPSRINEDSEEEIRKKLNVLQELKHRFPEKKLMVFSATMRISNNNINEEEKEYWSEYGEDLWAYSYHSHRYEKTNEMDSMEMIEKMGQKIPNSVLQDYLTTRERNFRVNLSLLEQVEADVIDVMVFPQDDTSEYGINIGEQEQLVHQVESRLLYSRVYIYPGADEVASVLVARMIYSLEKVSYPTFFPLYSGEKGALSSAMYEDRPIVESVKGQIYAFGGYTVHSPEEADIMIGVNVPGKRQGDLALQKFLKEVDTPDRNIGEWIARLKHYRNKGKTTAVADVAYANGADPAIIMRLLDHFPFEELSGFAAWNTAGNTIGTVVSQAAMVHLQQIRNNLSDENFKKRLQGQLVLRLLDDFLYQTMVRQEVRRLVKDNDPLLPVLVNENFRKQAVLFLQKVKTDASIRHIYLPWNRTFEIGLELEFNFKGE